MRIALPLILIVGCTVGPVTPPGDTVADPVPTPVTVPPDGPFSTWRWAGDCRDVLELTLLPSPSTEVVLAVSDADGEPVGSLELEGGDPATLSIGPYATPPYRVEVWSGDTLTTLEVEGPRFTPSLAGETTIDLGSLEANAQICGEVGITGTSDGDHTLYGAPGALLVGAFQVQQGTVELKHLEVRPAADPAFEQLVYIGPGGALHGIDVDFVGPGAAGSGRAIVLAGGALTLEGGSVQGFSSEDEGGAILASGDVTLHDVALVGNQSGAQGGALAQAAGTLSVTAGLWTANHADGRGGAAWLGPGVTGEVSVDATSNHAGVSGGALTSRAHSLSVAGSFTGNGAGTTGGAIHVLAGSLTLQGEAQVANNGAESGGGLSVDGGHVNLTAVDFVQNAATSGGGGGVRVGSGRVTLGQVEFEENTGFGGGGLYVTGTVDSLDDAEVRFVGNLSSGDGGGFLVDAWPPSSPSIVFPERLLFRANHADGLGGGGSFYEFTGEIDLPISHAVANSAGAAGGLIELTGSTSLHIRRGEPVLDASVPLPILLKDNSAPGGGVVATNYAASLTFDHHVSDGPAITGSAIEHLGWGPLRVSGTFDRSGPATEAVSVFEADTCITGTTFQLPNSDAVRVDFGDVELVGTTLVGDGLLLDHLAGNGHASGDVQVVRTDGNPNADLLAWGHFVYGVSAVGDLFENFRCDSAGCAWLPAGPDWPSPCE